MEEASQFTGSAAEMANSYQGQQAQLNAVNLEMSRTIGESMIPTLTQLSNLQLSITKGLAKFMTNNQKATSGIITFTAALLAMSVAFKSVKKAITSYTTATGVANSVTKAFTASLLANPLTYVAVIIAAVAAGVAMWNSKMQESIELMEEKTQKSKELTEALQNFEKNGFTYTESERSLVENERNEAQKIVKIHEEKANKLQQIKNRINEIEAKSDWNTSYVEYEELRNLKQELKNTEAEMKKFEEENFSAGQTMEFYKKKVDTLTQSLELNDAKQQYLTHTNIKAKREQLVNIAQTKADINGKKQLLKIEGRKNWN